MLRMVPLVNLSIYNSSLNIKCWNTAPHQLPRLPQKYHQSKKNHPCSQKLHLAIDCQTRNQRPKIRLAKYFTVFDKKIFTSVIKIPPIPKQNNCRGRKPNSFVRKKTTTRTLNPIVFGFLYNINISLLLKTTLIFTLTGKYTRILNFKTNKIKHQKQIKNNKKVNEFSSHLCED